MTNEIRQQESAIEMLRMMVASKRASPSKLDAAINELNRLKAEHASQGKSQSETAPNTRISKQIAAINHDVNSDMYTIKQGGLTEEIFRIRKDQSELSNMLHKVQPEHPCPDLVSRILDLHHKIEGLWDQKKYLDRNKNLSGSAPASDQTVVERTLEAVESKAELSVKIQKFREKRSKLKAKLDNPKATPGSRSKWEIEMAQIEIAIEEATTKRTLI